MQLWPSAGEALGVGAGAGGPGEGGCRVATGDATESSWSRRGGGEGQGGELGSVRQGSAWETEGGRWSAWEMGRRGEESGVGTPQRLGSRVEGQRARPPVSGRGGRVAKPSWRLADCRLLPTPRSRSLKALTTRLSSTTPTTRTGRRRLALHPATPSRSPRSPSRPALRPRVGSQRPLRRPRTGAARRP